MYYFRIAFMTLLTLSLTANAQDKLQDADYWKTRYLSVSYPLKEVMVTSPFGIRKDPFTGEERHHSGIDLKAYYEDALAMFDGTVEDVGNTGRSGNYVTLRHGEYTVSYCHLSKIYVSKGDEVLAGDAVAQTGNTGRSTAPHLHLTCKNEGKYQNPYTLIIYVKNIREECLRNLSESPVRPLSREDFFLRYGRSAMEQQKLYGIPASVTLGQMAYESGWGRSALAVKGNNYFGVKCSAEWLKQRKPFSLHDDEKKDEKFCNYANVDESIEHHSRVLMGDRYKRCRKYSPTDYHNWLVAIKACGYASTPDYVGEVEKIIKKYKLYLYDKLALTL